MNRYFTLLLTVSSCITVQAANLKRDRGEGGKEFWGDNYTVFEGKDLQIPCNSKPKAGLKASGFFWRVLERHFGTKVFGERPLVSQHPTKTPYISRAYGINHSLIPNTRTLKINNITRYASGTYTCTVFTIVPPKSHYLERTFFIVDVKAPARIDSNMDTKIRLSAGDKLELDCTSSGNPTPVITWHRLDGRPLVNTIKHNQGLFLVENVGQVERGEYRCVSSNSIGKDIRTFDVEVKVPARIMTTDISYGTIGKDGVVKCEAFGNPEPVFTWKWYKERDSNAQIALEQTNKLGRFSVKTVYVFEKSTSYLLIKNVRESDFKDYVCDAKNGDVSVMPIRFREYSVPESPKIRDVVNKVNQVDLSWSLGSNGGKPIMTIIIEYARSDIREWESIKVENPKVNRHTIDDLDAQKQYLFRIFAVNEIGKSTASTVDYGTPRLAEGGQPKTDPVKLKSSSVNIIVGGFAGGFFVLVIAIIAVCISMRNMQRNSAKKAAENAELAQNANQDTAAALINLLQHGGERLSSAPGSGEKEAGGIELTTSNKWEFPRDRLVLQNILGSGAFGIVMKAEADGINGINSGTIPVAVKFVKENESPSAKKDLVAELELLKLIEPHTNVINLLGCCTRSEPLMVIVEYCAYGDLQSFLRCSRGIRDPYYIDCYKRPSSRLTSKELLLFGTQIARGMAHLACLKVIHRDLAARNILVDENKVCKVSDFGFARDIYVEDHYTRKTAGGRFPIKWMAIESLLDGISTTKSDVWSFAIVLWEIITLGASPYPGMNSQEVVSFLQNGMRMEKPKHCSDELYNLLLDCWQVAAHRRPNFEMLARYLDKMYNDDFEYINMRTYDDHLYINFDGNTISGGSNSATLTKQDSSSSQNSQKSVDSVETPMI